MSSEPRAPEQPDPLPLTAAEFVEAMRDYPPTRRFTIRVCDDCFNLKGEMCSTPDCLFCWKSIAEIGDLLDALLIRPVIEGERLTVDEGELEPRP